jgi:hypothetical protein
MTTDKSVNAGIIADMSADKSVNIAADMLANVDVVMFDVVCNGTNRSTTKRKSATGQVHWNQ